MKWGIISGLPQRYANLENLIRCHGCKVLMEIGVNKGVRARKMILAALETPGEVHYHGFDLFQDLTEDVREKEASQFPWHEEKVRHYLKGIGVNINLYKGYSRDTLPEFLKLRIMPDFIFIDGGHSYETIESDWCYVKQIMVGNTIVVFDDYIDGEVGWGCQKVIDTLGDDYKVEFLEPVDRYLLKKVGSNKRVDSKVKLVKVQKC